MCDPVTIAGVVLTAAGTVMNMVANQQVQAARADALNAERIRQDSYNREAEALVDTSRDRYKDFGSKTDDRAKQLADYFAPANSNVPEQGLLPDSSSIVTQANDTHERGKAAAFTKQQSDALGNLRAFGDLFGETTRNQAADAARVGVIGSFKRGSNAVLPLELEQANHAGDGLSLLGSIVGGVGKLGIGAGLSGAKFPSLGGMGTSGAAAP